jgi:hypothetical protein
MDQLMPTLIAQGGFGLVAAIIFWLYMSERKDHQRTRDKYEASLEARRMDAKESFEKIIDPLEQVATMSEFMAKKLLASKGRRN